MWPTESGLAETVIIPNLGGTRTRGDNPRSENGRPLVTYTGNYVYFGVPCAVVGNKYNKYAAVISRHKTDPARTLLHVADLP
jgi:hypothetical protein